MLIACQQIIETHSENIEAYLDVGVLLLNFGYLTRARECFERVCELAPNDRRALTNLANLARDAGDHAETLRLYSALITRHPDHPMIRRNFLFSQEYDPSISDTERLQQAVKWGEWAVARAGGPHPGPMLAPFVNRSY